MADQNPTGSGAAVALELPADHVRFLRSTFEKARAGISDELEEFPDQLDPETPANARRPPTGGSWRRWTSW